MTKLFIVIFAAIFLISCAGSKNAAHRSNDAYIEIPVHDHYSINGYDYAESWRKFNEAKLTAW